MKQYVSTILGLNSAGRNEERADKTQTSALDTYTEQTLLQNINSILKDKARTSVFVAHRLRTIYDSDQILVLKDGKVAEQGTHHQLVDGAGVYSELWHGESNDIFLRIGGYILTFGIAQETALSDGVDEVSDAGIDTLDSASKS